MRIRGRAQAKASRITSRHSKSAAQSAGLNTSGLHQTANLPQIEVLSFLTSGIVMFQQTKTQYYVDAALIFIKQGGHLII